MNIAILTSHRSIPIFDPSLAWCSALNGGYTVHPPDAGPVCTNNEENMITLAIKKNQYESMLRNGEAISLAPI
jgi:hypothetical protein